MAAMPALAMAREPGRLPARAPAGNWLDRMTSQVGLAPLTIDRMPAGRKKPAMFRRRRPCRFQALRPGQARAAPIRRGRVQAGRLHREGLEAAARRGPEALPQAQPGRLPGLHPVPHDPGVRDRGRQPADRALRCDRGGPAQHRAVGRRLANLAIIPLRDGINFEKMKKPLGRVIEPAVTIVLVVLAFTFIPWLSRVTPPKGASPTASARAQPSRRT